MPRPWDVLKQAPDTRVFEGEIASNAASASDEVLVTIPAFDREYTWGPAPFTTQVADDGTPELPQEGDRCAVLFAETGTPGEPSVWILGYTTN